MEFLNGYLEHFTYAGLFVILILAGMGVPFPEDLTIVLSGYLAYKALIHLSVVIPIAIVGVVLGDYLIYLTGKRFGRRVAQIWPFRRFLTAARQARVRWFFRHYGNGSIFLVRFVSGIRAAVHLSAGIGRMNPWRFLWMDGLAALVSVPIFVGIGYYFGEQIDRVVEILRRIETGLMIAAAVGLTALLVLIAFYRREQPS
jgi:membrane protein DedA with SNARE-associated domain